MFHTFCDYSKLIKCVDQQIAVVVKDNAIDAGGLEFDSRADQSKNGSQRLAAMVLWSCVAQALSRGDGSRNSLRRNTANTMKI